MYKHRKTQSCCAILTVFLKRLTERQSSLEQDIKSYNIRANLKEKNTAYMYKFSFKVTHTLWNILQLKGNIKQRKTNSSRKKPLQLTGYLSTARHTVCLKTQKN